MTFRDRFAQMDSTLAELSRFIEDRDAELDAARAQRSQLLGQMGELDYLIRAGLGDTEIPDEVPAAPDMQPEAPSAPPVAASAPNRAARRARR